VSPRRPASALTSGSILEPRAHDGAALRFAPPVAVAMIAMWAIVGTAFSSAQWGDHFEQFIWAHSVQWGYHKHPPLPTWLLAAAIQLFGPSVESARALAVLCVLGTGLFTYLVARELFDTPTASLAVLFWGLQHQFSQRCHLFNHNTVLMLTISGVAWCTLRAIRAPYLVRWWLAVGFLTGLSLLAKYQAVVPLLGVLLAVWLSGELRFPTVRLGMVLAVAVAMAVITPHIGWVVQHHLSTLEYATQQGHSLAWSDRGINVVTFVAQQLRFLLPALTLGILVHYASRREQGKGTQPRPLARRQRAWLIGLIAFPFVATLLTAPLFGLRLQNHWGYQALQFVALLLAWRLRDYLDTAKATWLVLALAVHATFMALALQSASSAPILSSTGRLDAHYPAQQLADAVRRDWQDDTLCPLSIVVGPQFEAGLVSVYNGGTAAVLEDGDFAKTPWISPSDLERLGAVYLAAELAHLPSHRVTRIGSLDVSVAYPDATQIYWAIAPPLECEFTARAAK
jgi:4-amino-4-deoxy-L-arabinose transferase-like glycosyltransferase